MSSEKLRQVNINGMKALVDENNGVARLDCGAVFVQSDPSKRPVLVMGEQLKEKVE